MITLNKINAAVKFLLVMAPLFWVAGCTTVSTPAAETTARIQAEPGAERLTRYCRRMAETKNLRIATGICERALAMAPENPEPVLILAQAYADAQQHEEATEAFQFALSIDPENPVAHLGLGKLFLQEARLEEAQVHLEAAFQGGHPDPTLFNALGVLKDQQGQHAAAQDFYQSGLALDPKNDALANNLGVSLLLSKSSRENAGDTGGQSKRPSPMASTGASSPQPGGKPATASPETVNTQAAIPANTLRTAPQVPAPIYEVSVLEFFGQSRLLPSDNLDPAITPAPVSIVNFQTLPPLPAQQTQTATPVTGDETYLARALQDFPPSQASGLLDAETSNHAENLIDERAPADHSAMQGNQIAFLDLSTVTPGRNPFIGAQARTTTPPGETESAKKTRRDGEDTILLAKLTYYPIEMPRPETITKHSVLLTAEARKASVKDVSEAPVKRDPVARQTPDKTETRGVQSVRTPEFPSDSSVINAFHAARTTEGLRSRRQRNGSDVSLFSDVIQTGAKLPITVEEQQQRNRGEIGNVIPAVPAPRRPDTPDEIFPRQEQTPLVDPFLRSHSLAEAVPRTPVPSAGQALGASTMALMLIGRTHSTA